MHRRELYIDLASLYLGSITERILRQKQPVRAYVTAIPIDVANYLYELFKQRPALYTKHENYDSLIQLAIRLGIPNPQRFVSMLMAEWAWEIIGVRSSFVNISTEELPEIAKEITNLREFARKKETREVNIKAAKEMERLYSEFYEVFRNYKLGKASEQEVKQKALELTEVLENKVLLSAFITASDRLKRWMLNRLRELSLDVTASQESDEDEEERLEYTLKDIAREGYHEWFNLELFFNKVVNAINNILEDFTRLANEAADKIFDSKPIFTSEEIKAENGNSTSLKNRLIHIRDTILSASEKTIKPDEIYKYLIAKAFYLFEVAVRIDYILDIQMETKFHGELPSREEVDIDIEEKIKKDKEEEEEIKKKGKRGKAKRITVSDKFFEDKYYSKIFAEVNRIILDANEFRISTRGTSNKNASTGSIRASDVVFMLENYYAAVMRAKTGQRVELPYISSFPVSVSSVVLNNFNKMKGRLGRDSYLRDEIINMFREITEIYLDNGLDIKIDIPYEATKIINAVVALWLWYAIRFVIARDIEGKKEIQSVGRVATSPNRMLDLDRIILAMSKYEKGNLPIDFDSEVDFSSEDEE